MRRQGHLPYFLDPVGWQRLYAHDWVVHAKQPLGGPEAVLGYLGRYTHRGAISNERIVGIENDLVAFRARADADRRKRTLRLSGSEFIARFLLHVLPAGFKRIRHYGLLSPARKKTGLAVARSALAVPPPEPAMIESVAAFARRVARLESLRCPHCGGQLQVTGTLLPLTPVLCMGAAVRCGSQRLPRIACRTLTPFAGQLIQMIAKPPCQAPDCRSRRVRSRRFRRIPQAKCASEPNGVMPCD